MGRNDRRDRYKDGDIFDPESADDHDLKVIAGYIETFLEERERLLILREDMCSPSDLKRMQKGVETVRKLVKKLMKGKRSPFKDVEDVKQQLVSF